MNRRKFLAALAAGATAAAVPARRWADGPLTYEMDCLIDVWGEPLPYIQPIKHVWLDGELLWTLSGGFVTAPV